MATTVTLNDDEMVISKGEYKRMMEDCFFLDCLRNNGVDNWDWYDEAVAEYLEGTELGDDA